MRFVVSIGTLALLAAAAPNPQPSLQSLIRQRIHYVFVIYQENRSFDHYFGTFPGANGIYTADARAHGFSQYNPIAQRRDACVSRRGAGVGPLK
jgi:phospholipase C